MVQRKSVSEAGRTKNLKAIGGKEALRYNKRREIAKVASQKSFHALMPLRAIDARHDACAERA